MMKNRYIEIFNTYSDDEKCPNFKNDTIKLIYLCDKNKVSLQFLEEFLQKNLDIEKVNEIYIQLINEHQDLSKDIKDIIVRHFTENKNNLNLVNLLNILKICENLRNEIFSNLNKFVINEQEFLLPEETENYKFFKGLLNNDLLKDTNIYKDALYISKAIQAISSLEEKIKNDELNFNVLSIYFIDNSKDNKMEKILYDRLLSIYLLDENKAKNSFKNIKEKIYNIKEYIRNLEIVYRDYSDFYYVSHNKDIDLLNKICFNLKNQELNYFEKNVKNDYEKYIKHLEEAKNREKMKNSIFFNEIFKDSQNIFKDDDEKRLNETKNKFESFKKLFEPEGIYQMDKDLLELCLKPFEENEQKLLNELKTLVSIFEINEPQSLEKIYEEILLISKKSFMFNAAAGINIFIEKVKAKKTKFNEDIKDIIIKLKGQNNIENLKYCNDKLKELKIIDKKEKENKFIDILMKFKEQPDSIEFLLETSLQDIGNLQELATVNDNNYVTVNDIMDMGKCLEFFKDIKLENKNDFEFNKRKSTRKKRYIFIF